jgi:hypothetical protein
MQPILCNCCFPSVQNWYNDQPVIGTIPMTRMMLIMLIFLFARSGFTQDFELDTREALDVIKKWNFANNAMSESTFRDIYADRLIFYTQNLSREKCIALKKTTFKSNRAFKQKITSDPIFRAYTAGVVKADFIKEVFEHGRWTKFHSYLLITYEKNNYSISGESDTETDRKHKYKLSIGTPLDIPQAVTTDTTDTTKVDSTIFASTEDSALSESDSLQNLKDSTLISSVTDEVLSEDTVAIPKKYVYFLIGFLVLAAVIVVFSRRPKKASGKARDRAPIVSEPHVLRNDKGFENFVLALFDPHYFTLKTLTRQRVYAGGIKKQDFVPGLEFEFQNKESRVGLAIECIFIPQLASREILSYSANQINRYLDFEEGSGMEIYLVIGLEGQPDDPKELFLVPASDLREGYWGYKELQPFRKHGMFFYNSVRRRLL